MEKFVTLSTGIRMEYVEKGDPGGLPVALPARRDRFVAFVRAGPAAPAAHVHAFAISLRGHGDSSSPETGYLYSDMSRDLRRSWTP